MAVVCVACGCVCVSVACPAESFYPRQSSPPRLGNCERRASRCWWRWWWWCSLLGWLGALRGWPAHCSPHHTLHSRLSLASIPFSCPYIIASLSLSLPLTLSSSFPCGGNALKGRGMSSVEGLKMMQCVGECMRVEGEDVVGLGISLFPLSSPP